MLQQVADGIHRYADGLVNWYFVEDGDGVVMVDSGWPSSWPRITDGLVRLNRPARDVQAVLLTHGHPDHLGTAERLRTALDIPIHVHAHEAQRARGRASGSSPVAMLPSLLPELRRPSALRFVAHATKRGYVKPTWVEKVASVGDDDVLGVPGHPKVVACHGHTEGHVAYLFADRGVLFTGDALVTLNVLTGERGPQLQADALSSNPHEARMSLEHLAAIDADLVLPGHGDPWHGKPADAVQQAQARLA